MKTNPSVWTPASHLLHPPDQPGEYPFVCDKPRHLEGGMVGRFVASR